jgi:DNA (cytosine-5)-methyltransferase 1
LKSLVTNHYQDLIAPIRARLLTTCKPFVIENVPAAPLINPILLCGTMFGLKIKRHRLFECHPPIYPLLPPHSCRGRAGFTNAHHGVSAFKNHARLICVVGHNFNSTDARAAMQIPWMTSDGLREAIPPIMAHFITSAVLHLTTNRADGPPGAVIERARDTIE